MIDKKTVLVLGAGASIDFGFPSGYGLVSKIVGSTGETPSVQQRLAEVGYARDRCSDFIDALRFSAWQSVDTFLEHQPDFADIGKAAIAAALIPLENPNSLFRRDVHGPNWLELLWSRLEAPRDKWEQNKLSIVTFNYDRVIECFLFRALQSAFRLDSDTALALLESTVRIIHIHGTLGRFGLVTHGDTRLFEPRATPDAIQIAAAGVRVLHEAATSDPSVTAARELVAKTSELTFLGFGYGARNLERLGLEHRPANFGLGYGSSTDMNPHERDVARRMTGNRIRFDGPDLNLVEFLRNVPALSG